MSAILFLPLDILARLLGAILLSDVCIRISNGRVISLYGEISPRLKNDIILICRQRNVSFGYIYLNDKKTFINAKFIGPVSRAAQPIKNTINL